MKKPRPELFEGELSKPIVLGNRLALGAGLDRILGRCVTHQECLQWESALATAKQVEKAHILARRLGIEVSKPEDWGVAFVLLAEALHPGFEIVSGVDYLRRRPGAPPGRRSRGGSWLDLVDEINKRSKGETIIDACERLSKTKGGPWKGVDKLSLRHGTTSIARRTSADCGNGIVRSKKREPYSGARLGQPIKSARTPFSRTKTSLGFIRTSE